MIEVDDIQPGILAAPYENEHPLPAGAYPVVVGLDVFGRLPGDRPDDRRKSLRSIVSAVSHDPVTATIGITADGLSRLGLRPELLAALPPEFAAGPVSRASLLQDPDPDTWHHELGRASPDVIVMLSCSAPGASLALAFVAGKLSGSLSSRRELATFVKSDRTEHFGFRDGISNPELAGSQRPVTPGNGVPTADGWRALAAGEIIYGYRNETGNVPGAAIVQRFLRNGTFLVWRKIEQDLAAFRALGAVICTTRHPDPALTPPCEECQAMIVGRRKDGKPLVPSYGDNENDFRFGTAMGDVSRCAHIRRANPRQTIHFEDVTVAAHRIVRRSMIYEEEAAVGTVFRCYQASIADQFEFVQREWLNHGDLFREGRMPDPVAGTPEHQPKCDPFDFETELYGWDATGPAHRTAPHTGPVGTHDVTVKRPPAPLTTVKGSIYAFVPGRRILGLIAKGDPGTLG